MVFRNNFVISVNKHCHQKGAPEIDKRARRKLITASILCVIFMIGEIVGKAQITTIVYFLSDSKKKNNIHTCNHKTIGYFYETDLFAFC